MQPSGAETAPEEVLVIVDPAHQEIPEAAATTDTSVFLAPPLQPEAQAADPAPKSEAPVGTQADRLMDQYRKLGESQKYTYGSGGPGSLPLNFNLKVPGVNAPAVPSGSNPALNAGGKPTAGNVAAGVANSGNSGTPNPVVAKTTAVNPTGAQKPPIANPAGIKPGVINPASGNPTPAKQGLPAQPSANPDAVRRLSPNPSIANPRTVNPAGADPQKPLNRVPGPEKLPAATPNSPAAPKPVAPPSQLP